MEEITCYRIGDVQFSPNDRELTFNRYRSVKLSTRESMILQYMLDNPNKAITLTEILANCLAQYPCDPISTRKTIQLLSNKLELADRIEYPYIDCYLFRYDQNAQARPSIFKRLFGRTAAMDKALA